MQGEIPDPTNPPAGCRFSSRCPQVGERCRERSAGAARSGPRPSGRLPLGRVLRRDRRGYLFPKQPADCAQRRQDLLSAPSCETRYE
ncbi:hypothetical protein LNQ03_28600 [Klebsiella pneumoniae subsp. pneumoniae]|nr:hypothetical protein [Klebsiella pneumoniae subsp. pneumoniae]